MDRETDRFHALDALRAVMMLLGIVLHAAVPYLQIDLGPLVFKDGQSSPLIDLLFHYIHAFRMPSFFVMAGFFAALLYSRRGLKGLLVNRYYRLALPFMIFWPLLFAVLSANISYASGDRSSYGFLLINALREGGIIGYSTMHLWFIYYLLIFLLLLVPLLCCVKLLPSTTLFLNRYFGLLLRRPLGLVILTLPLVLVGYAYPAGAVQVDQRFMPTLAELVYHGTFFVAGWQLYKNAACIDRYRQYWWRYKLAGLLVFALAVSLLTLKQSDQQWQDSIWLQLGIAVSHNLASWLLVLAFIGLFVRFLNFRSPTLRYLTDSSYWSYLVHLPLLFPLALLFQNVNLNVWLKFAAVFFIMWTVCLLSYQLLVRRSVIGQLLNGRRY